MRRWRSPNRDNANSRIEVLEQQYSGLENAANEQSTIVNTLEREVATLKACYEDLENRSRHCNLHIMGVKEGRENGEGPVSYIFGIPS